jgi:hypothetical protein
MQTTNRTSNQEREKGKVYDPAFVTLSEETTQHSASEVTRQPTSRKGASSNIRSLAKLVAARERKRIRNSKHNRNNCTPHH